MSARPRFVGGATGAALEGDAGLWVRCENERCRELLYAREFEKNLKVCHKCEHHARLTARERIAQLVDQDSFLEWDADIRSWDPLSFAAADQRYSQKLEEQEEKAGIPEAVVCGSAAIEASPCELVVLDFAFMGASMGTAVGEKVARAADRAVERQAPLITFSASGGARMQEGIFSLMQMAKTVASIHAVGEAGVPYISLLTDPTLGGVTASFAGIGDVIIAEQGALVGFAGPRVIEQVIKQKLPPDAQRAQFLLEHGLVDLVLHRREIRPMIARLISLYAARRQTSPIRRSTPSLIGLAVAAGSRAG